ncbi:hypothetical protein S4A8_17846 [Salinisphaera sp. S4-8]|uniref:hypothetical protein n=1 Tax=Salinisphaera sp. S4-8 TaxID=633357 RepID=UPI0033408DED
MKQAEIRESAIKLEKMLKHYAKTDISAKDCLRILKPYIEKAKAKKIDQPIDNMPCAYTFTEGELRKYADLEEQYADFCFLVEHEDPDEQEKLIAKVLGENNFST